MKYRTTINNILAGLAALSVFCLAACQSAAKANNAAPASAVSVVGGIDAFSQTATVDSLLAEMKSDLSDKAIDDHLLEYLIKMEKITNPSLSEKTAYAFTESFIKNTAAYVRPYPRLDDKIEELRYYLFQNLAFSGHGGEESSEESDPYRWLYQLTSKRKGICFSYTMLYYLIFRRLGIQASAALYPDHIYLIINDEGRDLVFEPTIGRIVEPDYHENFLKLERGPQHAAPLSRKNMLGVILSLHLGYNLSNLGRYEESLQASLTGNEFFPQLPEILTNIGVSHRRLGHDEEGLRYYLEALELDPSDLGHTIFANLGNCYYDLKRYDLSAGFYAKALLNGADDPLVFEKYVQLITAHTLPANPEVMEKYSSAIEKEVSSGDANTDLIVKANAYAKAGEHQKSIDTWDELLKRKDVKQIEMVYSNKANSLAQLGKEWEALQYYQLAIKANPDFAGARVNMAFVLKDLRLHEESAASFLRAEELAPNDLRVISGLIDQYLGKEDYQNAEIQLKKLKENPSYSNVAEQEEIKILYCSGQYGALKEKIKGNPRYAPDSPLVQACLLSAGEFGTVIKNLESKKNRSALEKSFLALAYYLNGEKGKARQLALDTSNADPSQSFLCFAVLSLTARDAGNMAEASFYRELMTWSDYRLNNLKPLTRSLFGDVLFGRGSAEKAGQICEAYRKAVITNGSIDRLKSLSYSDKGAKAENGNDIKAEIIFPNKVHMQVNNGDQTYRTGSNGTLSWIDQHYVGTHILTGDRSQYASFLDFWLSLLFQKEIFPDAEYLGRYAWGGSTFDWIKITLGKKTHIAGFDPKSGLNTIVFTYTGSGPTGYPCIIRYGSFKTVSGFVFPTQQEYYFGDSPELKAANATRSLLDYAVNPDIKADIFDPPAKPSW